MCNICITVVSLFGDKLDLNDQITDDVALVMAAMLLGCQYSR